MVVVGPVVVGEVVVVVGGVDPGAVVVVGGLVIVDNVVVGVEPGEVVVDALVSGNVVADDSDDGGFGIVALALVAEFDDGATPDGALAAPSSAPVGASEPGEELSVGPAGDCSSASTARSTSASLPGVVPTSAGVEGVRVMPTASAAAANEITITPGFANAANPARGPGAVAAHAAATPLEPRAVPGGTGLVAARSTSTRPTCS